MRTKFTTGTLRVHQPEQEGKWALATKCHFYSNIYGAEIRAPLGYPWDCPWWLPTYRSMRPAAIYGYMQREKTAARWVCDLVLGEALRADGYGLIESWLVFLMARCVGWTRYGLQD